MLNRSLQSLYKHFKPIYNSPLVYCEGLRDTNLCTAWFTLFRFMNSSTARAHRVYTVIVQYYELYLFLEVC